MSELRVYMFRIVHGTGSIHRYIKIESIDKHGQWLRVPCLSIQIIRPQTAVRHMLWDMWAI